MKKYILIFLLIGLSFGQFSKFPAFYSFHNRPKITYEPETLLLLARMTTPATARQVAINNCIKTLKNGGVWSKLDVWQIYAQDIQANGLLNWIKNSNNAINTGSATFTADRGFTGNGTSMYISTGFMPATHGVNFTQNSATIGVYNRTTGTLTNGQYLVGYATAPCFYMSISTINNFFCRLNSAVSGNYWNFIPGGKYNGLIEIDRPKSTRIVGYLNGRSWATVDTLASTSSGLSVDSIHVLKNGAAASGYCNNQVAAFYAGSTLTAAEHLTLFTALETYMDAVGAGVVPGDTLINENAEGTGYDWGEAWTETGTVYEDSTSRPLRGSQSIYLANQSATAYHWFSLPSDTVWAFCRFRTGDATPSALTQIMNFRWEGANNVAYVSLNTNGKLYLWGGTATANGTTTLQDNTIYYIWFQYIRGTGSNAICKIYLDTDNTIPVSTDASLTTGTSTRRPDQIIITGMPAGSFVDQVMVIKNSMGDVIADASFPYTFPLYF